MSITRALLTLSCLAAAASAQTVHKVPQEHPTIQEAVNVAGNNDIIIISGGTYQEAVVATGKTNLVIKGKGKVIIDPPNDTGLTLDGCLDCTVEKIRVAGGEPFGIRLVDTSNCLFEKCRVDSSAQTGIRIEGGHDNTFEKCVVKLAGGDAVTMTENAGDFTHDNLLSKCQLIQPVAEGVDIEGNDNTVDHCRILKPGGIGCQVDDVTHGHDNHFTSVKVIQPVADGASLQGDFNDCTECKFIQPGVRGVDILAGSSNSVVSCKVIKSGDDAIRAQVDSAAATVSGCKVSKAGDDGIEVDSDGAIVQDNKVKGCDDDGVDIDGDNGSYTGNKVNANKDDGFVLSEGVDNTLSGNKAHGNKGFDLDEAVGAGLNDVDETNSFGTIGP